MQDRKLEELSYTVDRLSNQVDGLHQQIELMSQILQQNNEEKEYYFQQQVKALWQEIRKQGTIKGTRY